MLNHGYKKDIAKKNTLTHKTIQPSMMKIKSCSWVFLISTMNKKIALLYQINVVLSLSAVERSDNFVPSKLPIHKLVKSLVIMTEYFFEKPIRLIKWSGWSVKCKGFT